MTECVLGTAKESSALRLVDKNSCVLAATAIGGLFFLAGDSHKEGGQNWCLQSLSYNRCRHRTAASIKVTLCWLILWVKALYTRVLSIDAIFRCFSRVKGTWYDSYISFLLNSKNLKS